MPRDFSTSMGSGEMLLAWMVDAWLAMTARGIRPTISPPHLFLMPRSPRSRAGDQSGAEISSFTSQKPQGKTIDAPAGSSFSTALFSSSVKTKGSEAAGPVSIQVVPRNLRAVPSEKNVFNIFLAARRVVWPTSALKAKLLTVVVPILQRAPSLFYVSHVGHPNSGLFAVLDEPGRCFPTPKLPQRPTVWSALALHRGTCQ